QPTSQRMDFAFDLFTSRTSDVLQVLGSAPLMALRIGRPWQRSGPFIHLLGGFVFRKRIAAAIVAAAALIGSATAAAVTSSTAEAATTVPTFDHIVLVMFENHAYSQINGSSSAPYF